MIKIDYEKIDEKYRRTVTNIENKPHVMYIRYLLTKRYSPIAIKKELCKLGLSAPHEPALIAYYLSIIDPVIKRMGLSSLYADYKNRLLRKNERGAFSKNILIYRIHIDDNLDMQVLFCKFVKELEIDSLWNKEIYRYHGSASNLPVDEDGNRILTSSGAGQAEIPEKILLSPKRYVVDKLILENIPDKRIAQYCKENLKLNIAEYDVVCYKKAFFNIKALSIEERIKALEVEENSLKHYLAEIEDDFEMEIGEKSSLIKQTNQRLEEIADNIQTMNMLFSDLSFQVATNNVQDFQGVFADVVFRSYERFKQLDRYKDRDVVDPLFKTARMMVMSHDKMESIKALGIGTNMGGDMHSQAVVMELYKKRIDEIAEESVNEANRNLATSGLPPLDKDLTLDDIEGIGELAMGSGDEEAEK